MGEKGFGWTALVTGWVDAEMLLENSGPRDGQEAGFQVSGVLEQVFYNSCTKEKHLSGRAAR